MLRHATIAAYVADLPLSATMGMGGFRSFPPMPLDVWADHWFVGPEAQTLQMVMLANPWVYDEYGIRCELVILQKDVWKVGDDLVLGWVQVLDRHAPRNEPFDVALNKLLQLQPQF